MRNVIINRKIVSNITIFRNDKKTFAKMKRSKYIINLPRINQDIAYLSGVINGDGNIYLCRRKKIKYPRTKIKIFNNSKKYLNKINELFNKNFNLKGKITKKKDKNCYILTINNKIIWLYFVNFIGLPLNKIKLKVPKIFLKRKLFKYYLAGLFDTDGYFSKTFGIMLSGRNLHFLEELNEYSKKFHILTFSKPKINVLTKNNKIYLRTYMYLKKGDVERFKANIPLIHNKYKWARGGSNSESLPFLPNGCKGYAPIDKTD